MKIGTAKELFAGKARVAMTPDSALQLQKLGHARLIAAGAEADQPVPGEALWASYRGSTLQESARNCINRYIKTSTKTVK